MSAQDRDALTEVIEAAIGQAIIDGVDYEPDYIADVLLAAGWTRPVPDGDAIERAAEEAIADEIHNRLDEFVSWAEDTDDASGYHVLNDVPVSEVALVARRALAAADLLASPVREPGRSEGETCGLCRNPATGLASINDTRYCHGDEDRTPTCYEVAVMRGTGVSSHVGLTIPREPFPLGRSEGEIKAEALREAAAEEDWIQVHVMPGRRIQDILKARADRLAAQVSDTEGGE